MSRGKGKRTERLTKEWTKSNQDIATDERLVTWENGMEKKLALHDGDSNSGESNNVSFNRDMT